MSGLGARVPPRLRSAGASELELALLRSASREQPPRDVSEQIAAELGIALPVLVAAPRRVVKKPSFAQKIQAFLRVYAGWIAAVLIGAVVGAVVFVVLCR